MTTETKRNERRPYAAMPKGYLDVARSETWFTVQLWDAAGNYPTTFGGRWSAGHRFKTEEEALAAGREGAAYLNQPKDTVEEALGVDLSRVDHIVVRRHEQRIVNDEPVP